ncbi:hypothetical protein PVK06_018846 [Gossypium arboreum]|uniref:Aminotransferase-like plant mobile domain-containing protein n=1 Tax=Gossypium arboreum TaxID=29729 RepID=A0ABR0PIE6_GOSAR|nr:hypothetical protein PVK06_018846 [Gossypium arboreum]
MVTLDGYRVLRLWCHFPKYDLDEQIMPYLRLAGFGDIALIRKFDLRPNLLSALVERWCTETHTFIMPCGEYTITLEDIAIQLGLRVDDAVVTGRSKVLEPSVVCHRLLGRSPRDGEQNFTCLTLAWLRANFKQLSSTATEQEVIYSWGSAVLAALYYELCRATKHGFLWMSYSAVNIATLIPQRVHAEARMWCINTPVLNFSTVEWYNGDRVMRQFGCKQFVPVEPQQFADVHDKTRHGRHTLDWSVEHQCYVALWNTRYDRRPEMHSCMFDFSPSTEYMQCSYKPDIGGSSSYHPDMGGLSSYHPDMGGSSSYYLDIGGSSPFDLEQPPTSVDMFGNNMYSTPSQATIDPVANPSDVYNTLQCPPRQRRPVNRYTPNDDTTPGSFQF